ncbi:hypothetical protein D3OALGA1CA_3859 [Olavius algarvensis associated proteobacterium Delta 3]|nr:hypothetical protein D3OALGA1CA_3859 [Olavius algarvensis associated proteobacterium Delta 3]CAB5166743.1 hypothetical protein D3OALGB2SA_5807 [Olavius algarvensis associated proteobacterium Delta 3]
MCVIIRQVEYLNLDAFPVFCSVYSDCQDCVPIPFTINLSP